ncbi:transcription termination/antitermination protein NusG [Candidatus Roizmanbacteria bacterium CG_4_9_14_0_2_um_filter_39_13]|uniref:Transcription termination/antitermination protein NusG n=2 Tax=Candidatus Roizmaniibacteriota TaxID=1752723 RepID=A0A2M8F040_9BACT|nr:MAG: transcription termination/antitermination protein NusG [Candidatus Roizmanbacteria bacterium CG_4_9_14_0_2_um_filter_39_13]PJE61461.1 MAG: transcription termination/antitermination protein NusG [Candidatus Roizmanbacteria bacterium CG10_big_fil_rev_8_21_14_0_10_39_12]
MAKAKKKEKVEETTDEAEVQPSEVTQEGDTTKPTSVDEQKKDAHPEGKWFVLHSQTGHENRVKNNLEQRVQSLGVDDKIFGILVPTREVVVIKKGKKATQKEKVFPGYIFVHMMLDDQSWLVVRTTEGVTGFIGAGTKPTPISNKEVSAIMRFVQQEQPKYKAKFSKGEAVKITEGPFADFLGTVEGIDDEKGKLRVLVSIFDRETPVELDFLQVKKL